MPVSFNYDAKKRALYGEMTGELTIEEYQSAIEEIVSSKLHPPNVRSFCDLRGLDFSKVTQEFENQLISIRGSFSERRKVKLAFLVGSTVGFGMTRMFEILGDELGDETNVFIDYAEAEEWLLSEGDSTRV